MSQKIYQKTAHSIKLEDGRESWDVDIPAHAFDLWAPLIGTDVIGVYGMLLRLARANVTHGVGLKKLALACGGKCDKTFKEYCQILHDFGFIRMKTPSEEQRKMGVSTIFRLLNVPKTVTDQHVAYAQQQGWAPKRKNWKYQPLVGWLIAKPEDDADDMPWNEVRFLLQETEESTEEPEVAGNPDTPSANTDTVSENADLSIDPSVDPSLQTNARPASAGPATAKKSDWKNRTPRTNRGAAVSDRESDAPKKGKVGYKDPAFPSVAHLILRILKDAGHDVYELSANQIKQLTSPVIVKGIGEMPSPQQEYETYAVRFDHFAERVLNMDALVKRRDVLHEKITPQKVIDAVCGYHWRGGWLDYRPESGTQYQHQAAGEEDPNVARHRRIRELLGTTDEDDIPEAIKNGSWQIIDGVWKPIQ